MRRNDLIKKTTALLLTGVMVLGLTACSFGEKTPDLPTEPETAAEPEQPSEDNGESPSAGSGSSASSDILNRLREMASGSGQDGSGVTDDTYLLIRDNGADRFYSVSSTGEVIRSISYKELYEQMQGHTESYVSIYDPDSQYNCATIEADDGRFLYFRDYVKADGSDGYSYVVYAIDTSDYTPYLLWQSDPDDGSFLDCYGFYDGLFRFTVSGSRSANGEFGDKEEMAFSFDDASGEFVKVDTGVGDVFDAAGRKNVNILAPTGYDTRGRESFSQAIAECGWVLGLGEDGFYQITADGTVNELELGLEPFFYIPLYDSEKVYYTDGDGGIKQTIYAYDLKTGKTTEVANHTMSINLMGLYRGRLYYSYEDSDVYGRTHNYICAYDSKNGQTAPVYDVEKVPGASYSPGIDGFRIIGGQIYFIDFDAKDHALKWIRVDESRGKAAFEDTGVTVETIDFYDYGTVECDSLTETCPYCGTPLLKRYAECMVIDPSFSPKADAINAYLKEEMRAFVHDSEYGYAEGLQDDSECEYHKESPWQYCVTDDLNVGGVHLIDDHYMTVEMNGYWYGGGAHGYPNRGQHLFDLDTGEVKTVTDFYTGTEEEFKTLLAQKTKEDALSYSSDDTPYFSSEDPDSIYDQAYDQASFETSKIEFLDDGIIVIYPPYDMGSYAAGYIEVFISYKELLGRDSL